MSAADLVQRARRSRQANHLVRFAPVIELLRRAAPAGGTLLDVGSGSHGIATLLSRDWKVTVLDADFRDYGAADGTTPSGARAVRGDVRDLPFADDSFDVAVAIDLLEHLPADDRDRAITEICRVAQRRAVIACPAGPAALSVDRRIATRLAERGRPLPGWLEEHLRNGFPEVEALLGAVSRFGSARAYGNENLLAHERLVLAELTLVPAILLRLLSIPITWMLRIPLVRLPAERIVKALGGGDRRPTYRLIVEVEIRSDDPRQSSEYSMDSAFAGHGRGPQR